MGTEMTIDSTSVVELAGRARVVEEVASGYSFDGMVGNWSLG